MHLTLTFDLGSYFGLIFFDKKIAQILRTAGRILTQFSHSNVPLLILRVFIKSSPHFFGERTTARKFTLQNKYNTSLKKPRCTTV